MKVSEKNLPFPEQAVFGFQRLLHFHDHFRLAKNLLRAVDDLGADIHIFLIRKTAPDSGAFLHQNFMAAPGQCGGRGRDETDAMFLFFNFLRDADDHFAEVMGD